LASILLPFELEPYIQKHFKKVKPQFARDRKEWIRIAENRGQNVPALRELQRRLDFEKNPARLEE
jgi:hypothetical protein